MSTTTLEHREPASPFPGTMTLELREPAGEPAPTDVEVDVPLGWAVLGGRVVNLHWIEDLERSLAGGTIVRMESGRTITDPRPIDQVATAIVEGQIA